MGQLSPRGAVYTGTFDPVHLGHLDIIQRASTLFDELIVGVGINPDKAPLFSIEERVELIRREVTHFANVRCSRSRAGGAVRPSEARDHAPRACGPCATWSTSSPCR